MQIYSFDSFSRQISVAAITRYQRHISPHKGFSCAHRVLYGGESCSQYIKRVIVKEGLNAAFVKYRERFSACKQANQILRSQQDDSELIEEDLTTDDEQIPEELLGETRKKPFSYSRNLGECSDGGECRDYTDLAANCADISSGIHDCSAIDCSGADCSSLDCGSADCSFLDCGSCGN
jgi:putative component of membrane protein insertase Oxa1/YidC/SpoIIIJ protein YidD